MNDEIRTINNLVARGLLSQDAANKMLNKAWNQPKFKIGDRFIYKGDAGEIIAIYPDNSLSIKLDDGRTIYAISPDKLYETTPEKVQSAPGFWDQAVTDTNIVNIFEYDTPFINSPFPSKSAPISCCSKTENQKTYINLNSQKIKYCNCCGNDIK